MAEEINTDNDCGVGSTRGGIIVLGLQQGEFVERDRALRLAAWIVATLDEGQAEFGPLLEAVLDT